MPLYSRPLYSKSRRYAGVPAANNEHASSPDILPSSASAMPAHRSHSTPRRASKQPVCRSPNFPCPNTPSEPGSACKQHCGQAQRAECPTRAAVFCELPLIGAIRWQAASLTNQHCASMPALLRRLHAFMAAHQTHRSRVHPIQPAVPALPLEPRSLRAEFARVVHAWENLFIIVPVALSLP